MIVRANIKFGLHSSFLDRGFEAEDERLPGESIEDGVLRVEAALKRAEDTLRQKVAPSPEWANSPVSAPPQVIQLKEQTNIDDLKAEIYTAKTLEELKSYKLVAGTDKDLYAAYNHRLKELTQ